MHSKFPIPPLAGIGSYESAAKPGYSVDRNVELMRRYVYVKKRLYQISACFLNPTPEWEIKSAFSLHLWLDAEHGKSLRTRVTELREPPHHLDAIPCPKLHAFLEEAFRAQTSLELLTGIYAVIRPAMVRALEQHRRENNALFDHPTDRILQQVIKEENEMIAWGTAALQALASRERKQNYDNAWRQHLDCFLSAAGGINGLEPIPDKFNLPRSRATEPFVPSFEPKRDDRSGDIYNFFYRADAVYNDPEASYEERNLALMYKRFHEMDVPEMMVSIIMETKDQPWDYYVDLGRQIWDECRHALMGEVWLAKHGVDITKYPNHVGFGLHLNLDRTPFERHVTLYGIEQSLMDGKTGKKYEWEVAQAANDSLTTYFQDYDWADEVLHAQIGRRWLKKVWKEDRSILDYAREVREKPTPIATSRSVNSPQVDWWPRFVRDVLAKESTSKAGLPAT